MNARKLGLTQADAAYIADISVRTGQRLDSGQHRRPNLGKVSPTPKTNDPLAGVWEKELEPMLRREPRLKPMTLYEYLQEKYPDGRYARVLRTLQRRVKTWKVIHGPTPEVMFELRHEPGMMGLSDFTELKEIEITIAGQPLEHLLYHYRLAYSGWQYAQIIQGGESFIALSEGLQNALQTCGGAPKQHRTDSLSAAYRNSGGQKHQDLTQLYTELCDHYRLEPTRNNKGKANENGAIEGPHGHLKNRIKQLLYLRGSCDFANISEYQAIINQATAALNRQHQAKFAVEQSHLQPLPQRRVPDYEILTARVSSRSTIEVRCILYTVPSRLIGQRLELHLYHDRILGYFGRQQVFELPRLRVKDKHKRRGRCINYRHVIEGLRKKPRALLYCTWQQELLPNQRFRQLWLMLQSQFERDQAAVLMVEALYFAATQDKEVAVADYLAQQLAAQTLTLRRLQQQFAVTQLLPVPKLEVEQHSLDSYDHLLLSENHGRVSTESLSKPDCTAQTTATIPHAQSLGIYREPSYTGAMVLCQVFVDALRAGSRTTQCCSTQTGSERSTTAYRKKFYQL